jgi:dihydroorotase
MKILIRAAKIIDPASPFHNKRVDIFISGGKIEQIGKSLKIENVDREIDLQDLHVSRGWFDSSVSFGEPGFEERETILHGLDTAAYSGFTAIALNPNTNPVIDNNGAVTSILSKANKHAVKMYPIGALTKKSQGKDLADLYDMQQAGAIAFGDHKKAIMHPNMLKLALQYTQNFDALVQSFPQDNDLAGKGSVNEEENSTQLGLKGIPPLAEEIQVQRDLSILEYAGGKLHIPTISTAKSAKLIKEAKDKGLDVTCSVAIHNLIFSDDLLLDFDTNAKVLPPLRSNAQIKQLLKGLKKGTIDMVTSDHHPIDIENKKVEFENALFGTIGLETAFGTLLSIGTLEETIDLLTRGRTRFGIDSPIIEKGNLADLTLFTPKGKELYTKDDIYSTSKNSMFLNLELEGKVYGIITGENLKLLELHLK